MNVGHGCSRSEDEVGLATINTTPLVDVMLVLLIIFLITIPVVTTSIQVQLPKEAIQVRETKPENIIISVDQAGGIYWNDAAHARHPGAGGSAQEGLAPEAAARGAHPRRWPRRYEAVGRVIYACQQAGIAKVGFITEPPARGG